MGADSWRIVPYEGIVPFKRVRVRNDAQIQEIVQHLLRRNYVALLGAPFSEKTLLLQDVAEVGNAERLFLPIYINLWQTRTESEATFLFSITRLIARTPGLRPAPITEPICDTRSFLNHLNAVAEQQDRDIVLLIDHLQALPHDLIHSLLLALRTVFMERRFAPPVAIGAVVAGGVNLAGLTTGRVSPFNIAHRVFVASLDRDQGWALAEATLRVHGCRASTGAIQRILEWGGGDRWLIPLLCAWSAETVRGYQTQTVKASVVDRATERIWVTDQARAPMREAIQLTEEDPDTLLDILELLDRGQLDRNKARQPISRTGIDRLQLSGAVELREGGYQIKNRAFDRALRQHFNPAQVSQVLRMNGLWREAINYLAPKISPNAPTSNRADLLEAVVQSIYASDQPYDAYRALVEGIERGFGLSNVHVYGVDAVHGKLRLVYPDQPDLSLRTEIELDDQESAEAKTFRNGDYALRLGNESGRLVAALTPEHRPIGVVTIERYIPDVNAYVSDAGERELPPNLTELRRFLRHAATAIDSVMLRSAYREIGRAVLDAHAVYPMMERVLAAIVNAIGCDYVVLYLFDAAKVKLEAVVGIGQDWRPEWKDVSQFSRDDLHPAVRCLNTGETEIVSGADLQSSPPESQSRALRHHLRVFCPLKAASTELGTLEVGYRYRATGTFTPDDKRTLEAFADQTAIAVYNARLLQRTDAALARRVDELEKLRRISLTITSTLDLRTLLGHISDSLRNLFPGTEVTIWEYTASTRRFRVLQSSLNDPIYLQQELDITSLTGRAIQQREVHTVPDLQMSTETAMRDHARRLDLCSMLILPLISHELPLGAIHIYTTTEDCASFQNHPALSAFAAQAAIAIENARRYQDLEKAQRELEALQEQELLDLAYTLFHRIKNLVGIIPLQFQLLRQSYKGNDDLDKQLAHIEQSVRRVIDLADSLKTLLDLPHSQDQPVELRRLAESQMVHIKTNYPEVEVHIDTPVAPVWVLGDEPFLIDALQTLIDNACEAMEGHGRLDLRLSQDEDGWVEICVADTGPGITIENRPFIFKPGFTTKKDNGGHRRGMGLFTCEAIIRKHRGKITFESEPGAGAKFIIRLPAYQPRQLSPE